MDPRELALEVTDEVTMIDCLVFMRIFRNEHLDSGKSKSISPVAVQGSEPDE